jgi:hypothetical protein
MSNIGVHINHCCERHGCQYGDENCPVVIGLAIKNHRCEDCDRELQTLNKDIIPKVLDAFRSTMAYFYSEIDNTKEEYFVKQLVINFLDNTKDNEN